MTIGIYDHDSRVLANHILPKELIEATVLIAKVKGYENLDAYVVDVIADDLISIREGGQGFIQFGEKIAEYLDKIKYLEERYPSVSNNKNDDEEQENNIIEKYTTTDLVSKEEVEKRFGPIPPDEEEEDTNKKENVNR
jgi:hypothetical protein